MWEMQINAISWQILGFGPKLEFLNVILVLGFTPVGPVAGPFRGRGRVELLMNRSPDGRGSVPIRAGMFGLVLLASALTFAPAAAGPFTLDLFLGAPFHFDSTLKITQSGQEDLEFTADWQSNPFEQPLYWNIRLAYWTSETHGWAIDLVHDKLILANPPPEVQSYSHTHGYNFFTVQRLWLVSGNLISAAVGVVISHAESTVRGQVFLERDSDIGGGYYLTGPVIGGGFGRRFPLSDLLYVSFEGRMTWSRTSTPVVDGESSFNNLAWHVLAGLGVEF